MQILDTGTGRACDICAYLAQVQHVVDHRPHLLQRAFNVGGNYSDLVLVCPSFVNEVLSWQQWFLFAIGTAGGARCAGRGR
jgi:hypothetical protein